MIDDHVDIRCAWDSSAGWTCEAVVEGEDEIAYPTANVVLVLSDKPYAQNNPSNSGSRRLQPSNPLFSFIGVNAGQPIWLAAQGTPGIGEAWPGIESKQDTTTFGSYIPADLRVPQGTARPWIKINLESYTSPHGTQGHFSLYTTAGSTPTAWISTFDSAQEDAYYFSAGAHTHMNWAFSHLGIHKISLSASAFVGPGQTNPTGSSAPFTLTFAVGTFARWQIEHFSANELDDPNVSSPDADPDQDGLKNRVEFAFGMHPRQGDMQPISPGLGLPTFSLVEEQGTFYQQLVYPKRRDGAQFAPQNYTPQFTDDLAGPWSHSPVVILQENFTSTQSSLNAVWEKVTVRREVGASAPTKGFGRVALDP